MRISVGTRLVILCSLIIGLPADLIAQGGPLTPRTAEHRVSVVVPVIVTLIPPGPGLADRAWQVRTNDPTLRRQLLAGVPMVRGAGDTLRVTLVTP
jgi:hypothetical protein